MSKENDIVESNEYIEVIGARANNLKDISLKIPRNQLVVITGISGSGKSSLAFDTIYADRKFSGKSSSGRHRTSRRRIRIGKYLPVGVH